MKIISQQRIKSLAISPKRCVEWIGESFAMKAQAQLPAKISVHPADTDFFTSMPCLLPNPADTGVNFHRQYFGVKEVHRIEGAVPSLGSDLMLYDAKSGELLALMDSDWITTMRTGAVAAVSAKALRKAGAETYAFVGLGNTARASLLCILEAEPEKHFKVKLLRYKEQAESFIQRFEAYSNVEFEIMDNINDMAKSADVLISCITSATGQLVSDEAGHHCDSSAHARLPKLRHHFRPRAWRRHRPCEGVQIFQPIPRLQRNWRGACRQRPRTHFRPATHHRLQLRPGIARRDLCRQNI